MAQIDIKNCDVFIEDGYAGPSVVGTVTTGGSAGATSFAFGSFTGLLIVGDRITFAGDVDSNGALIPHTITALGASGGNSTSAVFTPATEATVANGAAIVVQPHRLQVRIGEGNFQWTEKRPVTYVKDRGRLDTVRLGDQEPVDVKMDATWVFLASTGSGSDTIPTIEEALKKKGSASAWISSSADPCEPFAVNLKIVYTPPCAITPEIYQISDFRYEELAHDLKAGTIAMSGKANVTEVNSSRSYVA